MGKPLQKRKPALMKGGLIFFIESDTIWLDHAC